MRRWILFFLTYNVFLWVATIIALGTRNQIAIVISLIVGIISMMMAFVSTMSFARLYTKDWFKSKKELDEIRDEERQSWKKAKKLVEILGEHEAIKLWNEKKEIKPE